ncbi:MAG: SIR2 family protein [Candidatus Brocadia sp.]|nr:SIR2 family protein [Candidatus Brocadia sp.]
MPTILEDKDWDNLLCRIKAGKCTPFLGAGASYGLLPLGKDIAQKWAKDHDYPLEDSGNLARVAQFLAVEIDQMNPKEKIVEEFKGAIKNVESPGSPTVNEIHKLMSDLPLPVYMTTNYDNFIEQALKSKNKNPKLELCKWNEYVKQNFQSVFAAATGFSPDVTNPVVFHLHGHIDMAESLVLTEDDYLDFLMSISDQDLLPARIREAFTGTSLLFIGYQISDWNFRVLFRSLVSYMKKSLQRSHVSVQITPVKETDTENHKKKAQDYLDHYFGELRIRVYWGTADQFAAELKSRWEAFKK